MARRIRFFPANQPNDSDDNPQFDEERPLHSVTTEDIFDKINAGLINRPDVAPQAITAPRGSVRGSFWSICASILIVLSTSAAFGFVQPLNDLLPQRMGDFLSDISEDLSASLLNRADKSADFEVAGDNSASGPRPVSPDQRLATAAVARAVSTTTITAEVRPSANGGGSGIVVEQAELPGATSEKAFALGATVLELGEIDGAEFATSKSAALRSAAPLAAPAPAAPAPAAAAPAAAPDQGNKYAPRKPALQPSTKTNPLKATNTTPAITPEPVPSVAPPVTPQLSAAQIDRLMARGEKLLQSGDIASARLLFQRVAAEGDRRGAVGVGMTYDPDVYGRLAVAGLTPDRKQAEFWYEKAKGYPMLTIGTDVNNAVDTQKSNASDTQKSQETGSSEWNAACARKYNSFEPSTGLYTPHSGGKRRCKLP